MRQKIFIGLLMMIFVSSICLAAPADRTKSTASGSGASKVAWRYGVDETAPFRVIMPLRGGKAIATNDRDGNVWMSTLGSGIGSGDYVEVFFESTPIEVRSTPPTGQINQLNGYVEISLPNGRLFRIGDGFNNSQVYLCLEIMYKTASGSRDLPMEISPEPLCGSLFGLIDGFAGMFYFTSGNQVKYGVKTLRQDLPPGRYYLKLTLKCSSFGLNTAGALYGAVVNRMNLRHAETVD
ncbi:hypothetical protein COT42_08215 [Candidatus Saganbacteria bacterium CG08_land_8_20_14_0_20_45_16]|uniref:Uncharacterized protein n=1 Tax=Candidatus Saganbacteria bacterium CG08_land_8_20_14_0_20_45_16 TaxID=2014293 RepID=A0A2H0XTZ3_UNCSA|nr:MAG: hypothetical protein COT42_08215 [Candidatus Saganbacteria bacterium CG08_land_8_20_14_0_20_45_16]